MTRPIAPNPNPNSKATTTPKSTSPVASGSPPSAFTADADAADSRRTKKAAPTAAAGAKDIAKSL